MSTGELMEEYVFPVLVFNSYVNLEYFKVQSWGGKKKSLISIGWV